MGTKTRAVVSRRRKRRAPLTEEQFSRLNVLRAGLSLPRIETRIKAEYALGNMSMETLSALMERISG